jgi:twitching motility two-component system response regulator PilH
MPSAEPGPQVLVVDDNILVCRTLARLLSRSGYAAQCIDSGEEALVYLQDSQPAVVFLDVMMPGISGFEVLKWIRQDERCKKVIVLMYSAQPDPEFQRRAAELGANDYIVKGSLSFDQIQALVDQHIQRMGMQ